jgi:hypothetical protein
VSHLVRNVFELRSARSRKILCIGPVFTRGHTLRFEFSVSLFQIILDLPIQAAKVVSKTSSVLYESALCQLYKHAAKHTT